MTRDTKNPEAIGIMSRAETASFRHFTEQARHLSNTGAEKQSRRMSLIEAVANVLVGYGVAVLTQILVFPFFGLRTSLSQNLLIGFVFTIVSIGRSYALRRAFERIRMHYAQTTPPSSGTDTSATPMMLSPGLVEQTSLDILGQHRSERRSSGAVRLNPGHSS